MPEFQLLIFLVILLALVFDFINGFHDTANAIATSVSTRAIHPQHAIIMAAVLNFWVPCTAQASQRPLEPTL